MLYSCRPAPGRPGTDYPFDMGMYEPLEFVRGAKLTAGDKQAILGGNAARLLKLKKR